MRNSFMEINFIPEAQRQLDMMGVIDTIENGFVMGQIIGKHIIIENFFPANFNEKKIDKIYRKIFNIAGERLMGVFFNGKEPFLNDWFLEDIIIKVNPLHQDLESFIYEFEKSERRPHEL